MIFDEAHQLEDVATEHFGARDLDAQARASSCATRTSRSRGMPLWTGRASDDAIHAVERAGIALFAQLRARAASRDADDAGRVPLPAGLFDHPERQTAWFQLDTALEELARAAEAESEPPPDEEPTSDAGARASLAGLARRARELRDDLATIAEQRQSSHVYWGEVRARPARSSPRRRSTSPISCAATSSPPARRRSSPPRRSTAAGDFAYTRARLGLDDADELLVASPFDYARQAMLYVPRDLPPPDRRLLRRGRRAHARAARDHAAAARSSCSRSHRALREAAARLADLPYPAARPGRRAARDADRSVSRHAERGPPRHRLVLGRRRRARRRAVARRDRQAAVRAAHRSADRRAHAGVRRGRRAIRSQTIQLPAAAIALKQGFGRLIRRRDDRGIVAILDGRDRHPQLRPRRSSTRCPTGLPAHARRSSRCAAGGAQPPLSLATLAHDRARHRSSASAPARSRSA